MFTTGTCGELTPVVRIDGRVIGDGRPGPVTAAIAAAYRELTDADGEPLPDFGLAAVAAPAVAAPAAAVPAAE